jgi:putative endonuclease
MPDKPYYTYVLRCTDNSLYAGITTDVKRRMEEHFSQGEKCAKYTKHHTPKKLEAVWESDNRSTASKLEANIKLLTKPMKEKLVKDDDFSVFGDKIDNSNYKRVKQ